MNQYKETPKPTEPFITIPYNHLQYDTMLNWVRLGIDLTERNIENIVSTPNYKPTEYLQRNKKQKEVFQSIIKVMLDVYDKKHKGGRHHSELEKSIEDTAE